MSKQDTEWAVKFALRINAEMPSAYAVGQRIAEVSTAVMELSTIATSLHRLAEVACERDLTERETKRDQRLTERAREIVASFGAGFGLIKSGGDPRGCPLLVTVPSGHTDDWGQRGLVVPY